MSDLERRVRRLEDREAVRELDASYCRVLDDGDWEALVACFVPDGEFVGLGRARGHDELRRFFAGLADGGLTAYWHHVSNLEISIAESGGRARVRSYLWQPCVVDGVAYAAAGRYADDLVRTDDGWRYRRKQVSFDYFARLTDGWDRARFDLESARAAAREGAR